MPLYHYTCADGRRGIERDGLLRPNYHPILGESVVWLTDLELPWRDALGLTSYSLTCDRTAYRYEVGDPETCVRWTTYARGLPRHLRDQLESAPGTLPMHWFVSLSPVPVVPERVT